MRTFNRLQNWNKEAVAMSAALNEKKALVKQKEQIVKEASRITDHRQKENQKLIDSVEKMTTAVEKLTTAEKQITLPKVTQSNKRQFSVVIENGYLYSQLSDMVEDQTGLLRHDGRRYRLWAADVGDPKSAREAVVVLTLLARMFPFSDIYMGGPFFLGTYQATAFGNGLQISTGSFNGW